MGVLQESLWHRRHPLDPSSPEKGARHTLGGVCCKFVAIIRCCEQQPRTGSQRGKRTPYTHSYVTTMGRTWRSPSAFETRCSNRDEVVEVGRKRSASRASRGRFSESWKRISSRQGSTKRSGLQSQQPTVGDPSYLVCFNR